MERGPERVARLGPIAQGLLTRPAGARVLDGGVGKGPLLTDKIDVLCDSLKDVNRRSGAVPVAFFSESAASRGLDSASRDKIDRRGEGHDASPRRCAPLIRWARPENSTNYSDLGGRFSLRIER